MKSTVPTERLARVKEILKAVKHPAIATVNEGGSPHNTPVFGVLDDDLHLYWASHPASVHSQNITRTGQAFIVLFDSMGALGGGLFMQCSARQLEQSELPAGLAIFNAARQQLGREPISIAEVSGDSPQRLYSAIPEKLWVNMAERNEQGHVVRDRRHEITLEDLKD